MREQKYAAIRETVAGVDNVMDIPMKVVGYGAGAVVAAPAIAGIAEAATTYVMSHPVESYAAATRFFQNFVQGPSRPNFGLLIKEHKPGGLLGPWPWGEYD